MTEARMLLSPKEVAVLGVVGAEKTLANWRSLGIGPPWVKVAGRIRYPREALMEWIETGSVAEPPEAEPPPPAAPPERPIAAMTRSELQRLLDEGNRQREARERLGR